MALEEIEGRLRPEGSNLPTKLSRGPVSADAGDQALVESREFGVLILRCGGEWDKILIQRRFRGPA